MFRGCVSGLQLQHLREALADPDQPDGYNWEMLDGYGDEDDKFSLSDHPELQEKVRRVIMQGFIDHEDWNGVCLYTFKSLPLIVLTTSGRTQR